jgi:serine/threonine protein kinase
VLELIGCGGMGAVYRCKDRQLSRCVALKVLPRSVARDQDVLKRFYREARAGAALDHPNIARSYEAGQERDQHFLVMEYVDGISLQGLVEKDGTLAIPRACHYLRQAALGLQHAHERGLVHRDIKPANLLVDRTNTVKILDMGLSRFYASDDDSVLTRDVLGTMDYLAPEQGRDSHRVDTRADIYSLGATCYFLLTGKTPFGKERPDLTRSTSQEPTPVRRLRTEVPEALEMVLARMMAPAAEERYQTAAEVARALESWTGQLPERATLQGSGRRGGWLRWCLLLAIGLAIAAWAGAGTW